MIRLRGRSARHAYNTCRGFGLGVAHALYRAVRYWFTGSTGRYRIKWRPSCWDMPEVSEN